MALATPHPAAAALARALIIMVAREISNLAMNHQLASVAHIS